MGGSDVHRFFIHPSDGSEVFIDCSSIRGGVRRPGDEKGPGGGMKKRMKASSGLQ